MDYQVEKTMQFRLEEARRLQRRADLVREARAPKQWRHPALRRSLPQRLWSWTPVRVLRERTS